MPRFFFHVYNDTVALDDEGRELPSVEAAREVATKGARELAAHEVLDGRLGLTHRIEVEDVNGAPVLTIQFKDVVRIHP